MDLPVNKDELNTIIKSLALGGDTALYQKLKLVSELIELDLPYKQILRETYGYVI